MGDQNVYPGPIDNSGLLKGHYFLPSVRFKMCSFEYVIVNIYNMENINVNKLEKFLRIIDLT